MPRYVERAVWIKAALRDTRGATAIEFALLAFPFFGLIAAIIQTSLVFLASQVLESALIDASRQVRIGEAQKLSREDLKTHICNELYGLLGDCSGMHLRVEAIGSFSAASVHIPLDPTCTKSRDWTVPESWSPGDSSDVVMVQAYFRYPLPIPLGPLSMANLADGSRLIGATYVFKNEPF